MPFGGALGGREARGLRGRVPYLVRLLLPRWERGAEPVRLGELKAAKQRENYLGNWLMAPVGRQQEGRDLTGHATGRADCAGLS